VRNVTEYLCGVEGESSLIISCACFGVTCLTPHSPGQAAEVASDLWIS
jgi:hypothetical protein